MTAQATQAGVDAGTVERLSRDEPTWLQALRSSWWPRSLAVGTGAPSLHVPRGVEFDEPLIAHSTLPGGSYAYLPHTLVVLEPGARATLLEEVSSPDGAAAWFGATADLQVAAEA